VGLRGNLPKSKKIGDGRNGKKGRMNGGPVETLKNKRD
jgi:hypothetical protein